MDVRWASAHRFFGRNDGGLKPTLRMHLGVMRVRSTLRDLRSAARYITFRFLRPIATMMTAKAARRIR